MLDLRRRQFITLIGGAWPIAARAEQPMGKLPSICYLGMATAAGHEPMGRGFSYGACVNSAGSCASSHQVPYHPLVEGSA